MAKHHRDARCNPAQTEGSREPSKAPQRNCRPTRVNPAKREAVWRAALNWLAKSSSVAPDQAEIAADADVSVSTARRVFCEHRNDGWKRFVSVFPGDLPPLGFKHVDARGRSDVDAFVNDDFIAEVDARLDAEQARDRNPHPSLSEEPRPRHE